jgi:hypothetical protein
VERSKASNTLNPAGRLSMAKKKEPKRPGCAGTRGLGWSGHTQRVARFGPCASLVLGAYPNNQIVKICP